MVNFTHYQLTRTMVTRHDNSKAWLVLPLKIIAIPIGIGIPIIIADISNSSLEIKLNIPIMAAGQKILH